MSETTPELPNPCRAILFDFDGTLADSYQAITASVNYVRASHQLADLSLESVKKQVGHSPVHLLSKTVGIGDPETNLKLYREHHPTVMLHQTHLLPGAREVLETVRRLGMKSAITSNKPRAYNEKILKHLGIDHFFETVLGPEDVPHRKPAPDMLLTAIQRLGVSKETTLYVGDMSVDVQTAQAAQIQVWVVPTGSEDREKILESQPGYLLENLDELTAKLNAQIKV